MKNSTGAARNAAEIEAATRPAYNAASVAQAAVAAAKLAAAAAAYANENYRHASGLAWAALDAAYSFCRAAAAAAEDEALGIDPEAVDEDERLWAAHSAAYAAYEAATEAAKELEAIAEAAGHKIRR